MKDIASVGLIESFKISKGGIKFDIVPPDSPCKTLNTFPSPVKKVLSLTDIQNRLIAAEKRRLSREYKKERVLSERLNHVQEVRRKRTRSLKIFKMKVIESYEKKLEAAIQKKAAYLEEVRKKNRQLSERAGDRIAMNKSSESCDSGNGLSFSERTRSAKFIIRQDFSNQKPNRKEELGKQIADLDSFLKKRLASEMRYLKSQFDSQAIKIEELSNQIGELTLYVKNFLEVQQNKTNGF